MTPIAAIGRAARKSGVGWRGERHDTVPGEFVPSEDGCPDGPDGGEGPDPHPGEAHLRVALRPNTTQLAVASVATTSLTTASISAVDRCAPACDAIQMTKRQRSVAATPAAAPKLVKRSSPTSTGGSACSALVLKASTARPSARAGAPAVTVIGGVHCHDPCCASALCRTSVIDVLGIVGSATRPSPRMSRAATPGYLSRRPAFDEILQLGCAHPSLRFRLREVFRALRSFLFRGPSPRPLVGCAARSCVRIACVLP